MPLEQSKMSTYSKIHNPKSVLKVLFITHSFIRNKLDFAGNFLFELVKGLQEKGIEIIVLAPHEKKLPLYEEIENVKIYRFRYAPVRYERLAYKSNMHELVDKGVINKFIFFAFVFYFIKNVLFIIKKEHINILHAHWWIPGGIAGAIAARITSIPYVLTTHGTEIFILRKFPFLVPLAKFTFHSANALTAASNPVKLLTGEYLRINPEMIAVFPMPYNNSLFYPKTMAKNDIPLVLSNGILVKRKGFKYLIEAVKILKEKQGKGKIKFIIIGEGPEEKPLKQKIQEYGLTEDIEILPYQPKSKLNDFYNSCDVFVLPAVAGGQGEKEGLGVVLLQALSCKKPVVATNSGGIPDIIKDKETGLLVPEEDPKALAEAIETLLKDKELSTKVAETGHKFVTENFTADKAAKKTIKVYSSVFPMNQQIKLP